MTAMVDHALQYIGRGWRVFPIHSIEDGRCSCGKDCGRDAGKHPRTRKGVKDATAEPAQIIKWWRAWPDANIAVATGSGLVVVDIDGERDLATLARLKAAHGPLPETLTAKTGRGFHLYYRGDLAGSKTVDGLLVRGEGGYCVAPPSSHANGTRYQWALDVLPAPFPEFMKEWLQAAGGTRENTVSQHPTLTFGPKPSYLNNNTPSVTARARFRVWDQEEVDRIESALAAIPASCDRATWLRVGMSLHDTHPEQGFELWNSWSATCPEKYSLHDVETRWASFGKPGRGGVTLGSLFHEATARGWTGNAPAEYIPPTPVDNKLFTNGRHSGPTLLPTAFTAKPNGSPLIALNEKYAVIGDVGGKCLILSWAPSPVDPTIEIPAFQTFKTFAERHSHRYLESKKKKKVLEEADPNADPEEKEWVQLGTAWLKWPQRRTFERLELQPNAPVELPDGALNLWRGFGVTPAPGCWNRMKAHIAEVLAAGDTQALNYIVKWAAWAVQHPDKPAGAALVFRGGQGAGKGVFARTLCQMFGQHGVQLFNSKHMVGFNALLRNCLLLYADEAFWAGDKQGESTLKGLITEPSIVIESKGVNAEIWKNRLHVVMTSNADWVVPAGHDSRRYAMFDVAESHKQNKNYFDPLYAELDNGGREAMLYDLLRVDLGTWAPSQIVKNKALEDQKARSLDPLADWYLHILSEGRLPAAMNDGRTVPSSVLYNNAQLYSRQLGNTLTATRLGLFLRTAGCIKRANAGKPGNNGWLFPELGEARRNWEERFGGWAWGDSLTEWATR